MTTGNQKIQDISLILKDLLKVIKVVSMYPENNPLPQSLRRSFAEKLESVIDEHGEIAVDVHKDFITYLGDTVFHTPSREENLASIFYEAGITRITFKPGLDVLEIYKLLDVIKLYVNTPDISQDLAALVWEAGCSGVELKTLEDVSLSEYDDDFDLQKYISSGGADAEQNSNFGTERSEDYYQIFSRDPDSGKWESSQLEDSDVFEPSDIRGREQPPDESPIGGIRIGDYAAHRGSYNEGDSSRVQVNDLDDSHASVALVDAFRSRGQASSSEPGELKEVPNTALILNDEFKLSEEEEEFIRDLIEVDAAFEPYLSTVELLKEMMFQEPDLSGFSETVTICEKVMGEFIREAKLVEAGQLLSHMKSLDARVRKDKPVWADRLKEAYVAAGSRNRLEALGESLNSHPQINDAEVRKYLSNFGWEAMNNITSIVTYLQYAHHKNAVLHFLADRGKENIDLVARGIFDKNTDVVMNAISILAQVGDDKALNYLSKVVTHKDAEIRMQLMLLLKDCANEKVLPLLRTAISDPSPQVRRTAVNSIVSRRGQTAFDVVTEVINDDKFPSLEQDDQQSLLNAFSVLGGEAAVGYLAELITTHNLWRNHTLAFLRSAAFDALIINRSEKAEQTLLRLSRSWRPDIKRQANDALHRRRELKYGDD